MGYTNQRSYETLIHENHLSLDEVKERYSIVGKTFKDIRKMFIQLDSIAGNLYETDLMLVKHDNQTLNRQRPSKKVFRTPVNDRVFPFNTVELQRYSARHDIDIDKAMIHIGPYANELARSFNALALTIGSDIFFRDKAYNPGSE